MHHAQMSAPKTLMHISEGRHVVSCSVCVGRWGHGGSNSAGPRTPPPPEGPLVNS